MPGKLRFLRWYLLYGARRTKTQILVILAYVEAYIAMILLQPSGSFAGLLLTLGWGIMGAGITLIIMSILGSIRPSHGYVTYVLGRLPRLRDGPHWSAWSYTWRSRFGFRAFLYELRGFLASNLGSGLVDDAVRLRLTEPGDKPAAVPNLRRWERAILLETVLRIAGEPLETQRAHFTRLVDDWIRDGRGDKNPVATALTFIQEQWGRVDKRTKAVVAAGEGRGLLHYLRKHSAAIQAAAALTFITVSVFTLLFRR